MKDNRESVKDHRNTIKDRIVISMGGKCQVCGYNRCNSALELHHINPKEKEMTFGRLRSNCFSWNKVVIELRKCVLLCSNCHKEVHAGFINIPTDYFRFNESFAEYKIINVTFCPVCGKEKEYDRVTCSRSCAGKLSRTVDWNNIDLVYLLGIYKTPSAVAKFLGITRSAVGKRMKKSNIVV